MVSPPLAAVQQHEFPLGLPPFEATMDRGRFLAMVER
jgi:hypothetical protein